MIGEEIRKAVFRDTTTYYHSVPPGMCAPPLIRFAKKYAGQEILDLGCATGNYCLRLSRDGFTVKGADVNREYVDIARSRGVDAYVVDGAVPFPDRSFDTVLLFEVLEHLQNPGEVLQEAARLARRNVLITTPHSGDVDRLREQGLLFEHFADLDHRNFFTVKTLRELLLRHFPDVRVSKGDGINPLALIGWMPLRLAGKVLTKLGILRPRYHFRCYAVASVGESQ